MKFLTVLCLLIVMVALSAGQQQQRRRRPDILNAQQRQRWQSVRGETQPGKKQQQQQRGDIAESCRREPGCEWECGSEFCTCRCKVNEQLLNARYSPPKLSALARTSN